MNFPASPRPGSMNFALIAERLKAGTVSIIHEAPMMIAFVGEQTDPNILRECNARTNAILAYLANHKDVFVEDYNAALRIKAKVEHRLGEVLAETVQHGGHNKTQGNTVLPCSNGDLPKEITKMQSSRAQQLAAIPWDEIDLRINAKTADGFKASLSSVVKEYKRDVEQREFESRGRKLIKKSSIITGDFRLAGQDVPDNVADLIFTDPPYDRASIELYEGLSEFAARVLRPGGSCIVYFGQHTLPEVVRAMQTHLRFWWTLGCIHTGQTKKLLGVGVIVAWKPMLWFLKGDVRCVRGLVIDAIRSEREKNVHDWQQGLPEALHYVEHLCAPGGLVIDPFCGGGTTLVAAKQLNRRYLGFEIDPKVANRARGRLANAMTLKANGANGRPVPAEVANGAR